MDNGLSELAGTRWWSVEVVEGVADNDGALVERGKFGGGRKR